TEYEGPARRTSTSETENAGCPAAASAVMVYRSSAGAMSGPCLLGGAPAGTSRTRSRARRSRKDSARTRWPRGIGLNVPPRTPSRISAMRPVSPRPPTRLLPELSGAQDDELRRGQLLDPDGAAGVQLGGGDAELRPHPELVAVAQAGRGVDQHAG